MVARKVERRRMRGRKWTEQARLRWRLPSGRRPRQSFTTSLRRPLQGEVKAVISALRPRSTRRLWALIPRKRGARGGGERAVGGEKRTGQVAGGAAEAIDGPGFGDDVDPPGRVLAEGDRVVDPQPRPALAARAAAALARQLQGPDLAGAEVAVEVAAGERAEAGSRAT